MQAIIDFVVRAADLAEAEGRLLRAMAVRLALGIAIIAVSAVALGAAVVLLLASLYIATSNATGPAVGTLVTGLAALLVAGGLAWLGRRIGG